MAEETTQPSSQVNLNLEQITDILTRGSRRDLNWEVMNPKVVVLQSKPTIVSDCSAGNHFRVTLTTDAIMAAPVGMRDGQRVIWEFIQDGTGTRLVTLNSIFTFGTDPASFTATTTASKRDFVCAVYNQTTNKFYVMATPKNY